MRRFLVLCLCLAALPALGQARAPMPGDVIDGNHLLLSSATYTIPAPQVISVEVTADTITITYSQTSQTLTLQYCPGGCPNPPHIWREVYGVKDGKIVLLRKEEGKVIPATPERMEWPE